MVTAVASRVAPEVRSIQERKFAALLRRVLEQNEFYRAKLEPAGFRAGKPAGLSMKDQMPFTARHELLADQQEHPPYGTNLSFPSHRYTRLHEDATAAGGGLAWLDTEESWSAWLSCWEEIFRAAGVTEKDRVLVAEPAGGAAAFRAAGEAAARMGALLIGAPSPERRAVAIARHAPTVLVLPAEDAVAIAGENRPGAVERVLAVAGADLSGLAARQEIEKAWEADCRMQLSSLELGPFGVDCGRQNGIHLLETSFVAEVVDPATHEPVEPDRSGAVRGELVLTTLWREGSPVIRYLTGTEVLLDRSPCACGEKTAVVRPA